MKPSFAALDVPRREAMILAYARARFIQAEHAGGLEDPFISPKQIQKKFGAGAWAIVEALLASGELLDASEGGHPMVVHRYGARLPEMRT